MDPSQADYQEDEITLKELILGIRDYSRYLWTKKWWIIAVGLLGGLIGFYRAYTTPVTYTAELTFMVNEDEGSSMGGLGSILGQFGLGGAAASEYNLDKIVALSRSKRIVEPILFDTIQIEEQADLIANHLIRVLDLHEEWANAELEAMHNFYFSSSSLKDYTRVEKNVIQQLYERIVGVGDQPGILECTYAEKTGILKIATTTTNEELSIKTTKSLYENLSDFYVKQSTQKQQQTVDRLSAKADSTNRALNETEYQLAQFNDRSLGLVGQRFEVEKGKLNRKLQVLAILYGEVLKNRETAAFILQNSTPFFQVVDDVSEPAEKTELSSIIYISIFGLMFGAVTSIILIIWTIISSAVRN